MLCTEAKIVAVPFCINVDNIAEPLIGIDVCLKLLKTVVGYTTVTIAYPELIR